MPCLRRLKHLDGTQDESHGAVELRIVASLSLDLHHCNGAIEMSAVHDLKWSTSEKKLARAVFDAALKRECASILCEFKMRASEARTTQDMWDIEDYLTRQRRDIDSKYDYRYSQILLVFGRLLREGRIEECELHGLSPEKLSQVQQIASLNELIPPPIR